MNPKSWFLLWVVFLLCILLPSCASRRPTWVVEPANRGTVMVLGEVAKEGVVPWVPGMTARQCLLKAGGTTQFANVRRVRLMTAIRKEGRWDTEMIEQVINVRSGKPDIEVPDQSVIIVPEMKVSF